MMEFLDFIAQLVRWTAWPIAVVAVVCLLGRQVEGESVAQLVGSTAWPIAVVVVACLLHKELGGAMQTLARRLVEFDLKKKKAKFGEGLNYARLSSATSEQAVADTRRQSYLNISFVADVEMYEPQTEVMAAWVAVEEACASLLAKKGIAVPKAFRALGSRLNVHNLIDEEHARILDTLRQLRNLAAHGGSETIAREEAVKFQNLAYDMIDYLSRRQDEI